MFLKNSHICFVFSLFIFFTTAPLFAFTSPEKENVFSLQSEDVCHFPLIKEYSGQGDPAVHSVKTDYTQKIFGASVSGAIKLHNDASYVRVILIDQSGNEYLIYEAYPLLVDDYSFSVKNACVETKILEGVIPESIQIVLLDARLEISNLTFATEQLYPQGVFEEYRDQIRDEQHRQRIENINKNIQKKGMTWRAGETSLSRMTYAEKKCSFGKEGKILGNLQGFEYYADGIFELKGNAVENNSDELGQLSNFVPTFDWRERHGATNPSSPYYQANTNLVGWGNSLRNQGSCGSCWAHSTCATAEIMTSLYYNQLLDIDLAEQYLMACSCPIVCEDKVHPCNGGWSTLCTKWAAENGILDEKCIPYAGSNTPKCGDTCSIPRERMFFAGSKCIRIFPTEDSLKGFLIHNGPLNAEILSMGHCMCLVGFTKQDSSGKTIWIFKNSYGVQSGRKGYMYATIDKGMVDFRSADAFVTPIKSMIYKDSAIRCLDLDKDGYYNWGIGPKPKTCPECPDEEDCDDSRSDLGTMADDGSCKQNITSIQKPALNNSGDLLTCTVYPGHAMVKINLARVKNQNIRISIHTLTGTVIKNLLLVQGKDGNNHAVWHYTDDNVSQGIYLCRITNGGVLNKSVRLMVAK